MSSRASSRAGSRRNSFSSPFVEPSTQILLDDLVDWKRKFDNDPKSQLAATLLKSGIKNLQRTRERQISDMNVFSIELELEGNVVTDQKQSGRCWLFAMTNVLRVLYARQYHIQDFQLSQSHLFFYDHIAKSNSFLEQVLRMADLPIDSREMNITFQTSEVQDGGDYDMVVSLIQEYGLVPQTCYPETENSEDTEQMDNFINSKLRDFALDFRRTYRKAVENGVSPDDARKKARQLKSNQLREVYGILAICVGAPIHPNKPFTWEYIDKSKKAQKLVMTPLEFARSLNYDLEDTILLSNDPRHEYDAVYSIKNSDIVVGRRSVRYVNVPSAVMVAAVTTQLDQARIPIWFGSDVNAAIGAREHGIMDVTLVDYEDAFSSRIRLNKAERLRTTDSMSNHAMVFVGCHVDDNGKTVRYKVANSWGKKACDHGYLTMTAKFFEEYVYEVAVLKAFVPRDIVDIYENDQGTMLPLWDPMA